jgi:hypothetical protein
MFKNALSGDRIGYANTALVLLLSHLLWGGWLADISKNIAVVTGSS